MTAPDGSVLIHASAVMLGGAAAPFGGPADAGVLLLGASGSGKSDVALRLIAQGARLVADDQTAIFVQNGVLFADMPRATRGLLEIRGVGIVALEPAGPVRIVLAVRLTGDAITRLPAPAPFMPPAELALTNPPPLIELAPFEASTPAKIAAAASAASIGTLYCGFATP
jgi:hypothetical protein